MNSYIFSNLMKIGLLRHSKVILHRNLFSSGTTYNTFIERYENAGITKTDLRISFNQFPVCYVSSSGRAVKTAEQVYDGRFIITDALKEVPIRSFYLPNFPVPTLLRSLTQRSEWYLNYKLLPETKFDSYLRADDFIDTLLATTHEDTLLVTHGFFMQCLIRSVLKEGFKGRRIYFPKNATLYEFENKKIK